MEHVLRPAKPAWPPRATGTDRSVRPAGPAFRFLLPWLGLLLGPGLALAAPEADLPRTEPLALVVQLAGTPEPLSLELFVEAAVVFSGTQPEDVQRVGQELRRLTEEARQAVGGRSDARGTAEALLGFLHERVLVRYDERQTRIDVVLEGGTYNCVSSGVLYALVAKSLGLRVWGVRTEDHAFCRVQAGGEAFDVETTSPFGFDPGTRKEFTDSFGKVTGYTYVPPSSYHRRNEIGERALLGLILYNRTAFLSDRKVYLEAVAPAVDAHALLGDQESYERMIVSFLNLGSWYGLEREFSRGVEFLTRVVAEHPEPRLESLREDLLHNWVLSLVEQREFAVAETLLDAKRSVGEVAEGEWKSLIVYVYQMKAQEAARTNFAVAARLIEEGLRKAGADGALQRSFEVYVHNEVVSLVRARRLQEALGVVDWALAVAPQSALLRKDHSLVTTQLATP